MLTLPFTLTLHSDGVPSTGRGGDIVNSRVPRDARGVPLPTTAEQLVGLMRDRLRFHRRRLEQQGEPGKAERFGDLIDVVLGGRGRPAADGYEPQGSSGRERICRVLIGDVLPPPGRRPSDLVRIVSRTAVDERTGSARHQSLRIEEMICVGTRLQGTLLIDADEGSTEDLACRFALTGIRAVGGNRTRGSGRCTITIDGETRPPGALLKALCEKLADWSPPEPPAVVSSSAPPSVPADEACVLLRLVFRAEAPICCPEIPVGTGSVRSGFEIPASAVQGMLLTRIDRVRPGLADALFRHPRFRAWPMLPCGAAGASDLPVPTRVSLSHRVAKLAVDGSRLSAEEVADEAIEPYDWRKTPDTNPLKATGGVLLRRRDGTVALWKASSIPRFLSAHGVLFDEYTETGRNLYQMERIAPLAWMGFACLPQSAAELLAERLEQDPHVLIGRGKTRGELAVDGVEDDRAPWAGVHDNLLILQSPVLLSDTPQQHGATAQQELRQLVQHESTRGNWADLEVPPVEKTWAVVGIRFGWNRHGHGVMTGRAQRLKACRVLLPGSVIRFADRPPRLRDMLQIGLGGGRERGYGALRVHPGRATELYAVQRTSRHLESTGRAAVTRLVLDLWRRHRGRLPSPSQVYAVQNRLEISPADAREYLASQKVRTPRIWSAWEPIHGEVERLLEDHPDQAADALRLLADLCIADQKEPSA